MLKKTLNPEKLKVKYILENHTPLKTYPDAEDVLFEYLRDYCNRPTKESIKFTDASLQKRYSLPDEKLREILFYLKDKGFIREKHGNSAYVTYEITKNPY